MVERRPGSPNRYRLLDTVRRYAVGKLDAAGERERRAGCPRCAGPNGPWRRSRRRSARPRQDEAMAVAAARAADVHGGMRPRRRAGNHRASAPVGDHGADGPARRTAVGPSVSSWRRTPASPPALRARAWSTLANLASDVGDGDGQADAALEALAAANEAGDDTLAAWARYFLVLGRWAAGRVDGLGALIDDATLVSNDRFGARRGVDALDRVAGRSATLTSRSTLARCDPLPCSVSSASRPDWLMRSKAEPCSLSAPAMGRPPPRTSAEASRSSARRATRDAQRTAWRVLPHSQPPAVGLRRLASSSTVAAVLRDVGGHGMRVWERAGHHHVVSALVDQDVPGTPLPPDLDITLAADLARGVLGDRQD